MLWIWVATFCLAGGAQTGQPPTELVIRAVDESGTAVRLTRTDVYFDVWGGDDVTRIPHDRSSVGIGLDRAAACVLEPALCANHPTFGARILLEAEGLAPVSSDLFDWMNEPAAGSPPRSVTVRFPGAAPLRIAAHPNRRQTVTLPR